LLLATQNSPTLLTTPLEWLKTLTTAPFGSRTKKRLTAPGLVRQRCTISRRPRRRGVDGIDVVDLDRQVGIDGCGRVLGSSG